jgi:hypothetical protein
MLCRRFWGERRRPRAEGDWRKRVPKRLGVGTWRIDGRPSRKRSPSLPPASRTTSGPMNGAARARRAPARRAAPIS